MHALAVTLGLIFVAVQIALVVFLRKRIKSQTALYRRCLEEKPPRGTLKGESEWIDWLDVRFPPDSPATGQWDRENALEEFDREMADHPCFQLLHRATIMAPLIGVLITAIGFMVVDMPTGQDLTMQQILSAIAPLYYGVITGAVLAILNQLLLLWVTTEWDQVRKLASQWFDTKIWPGTATTPDNAAVLLTNSLTSVGGKIMEAADKCTSMASTLETVAKSTEASSQKLTDKITGLEIEVGKLVIQIDESRKAVAQAGPIADVARSAAENFRKAVDESFVPAANEHRAVGAAWKQGIIAAQKAITILGQAVAKLDANCDKFKDAADLQSDTAKTWKQSVDDDVVPANKAFHDSAKSFDGSVGKVEKFVDDGIVPSTQSFKELQAILATLQQCAVAFAKLVALKDQLGPVLTGLSNAASTAQDFHNLPTRIGRAIDSMEEGIEDVSRRVLRSQIDDLEGLLAQTFKQVALFSANGNGNNGG